jgi:hypothetical protein
MDSGGLRAGFWSLSFKFKGGKMTKKTSQDVSKKEKDLLEEASRLEEDLAIMEEHPDQMDSSEDGIVEDMRKRDRERKDTHLHSVPKSRKHVR